ncbi:MAG: hypothetical protein CMN44_06140 [SAR116 cluster bacterium]|nr:hypothetical protein [SAR116 cluster bacterium]RPH09771.1 MAG: DMT family transporter [Alphaproteobacteria bacterium TMED54]|tara:strand:- start:2012 stop:2893 length:882 start_codon:yes stop_codon:yes gene_type:complete
MKFKSKNTKGILIAFLGALLLTPDTLFMRLSEMNVWTMLFWRGFQMGVILIAMTLCIKEYRDNFFLIFKKTGVLIILIQASGSVFFTLGIVNSSVALILFCIATGPLFAAFFSLIILKEKIKKPTTYASLFSLIGIIIVVTDPSKVTNAPDGSLIFGTICGLLTAITLGLYFVLLRANPKIPAFGTTGFGAITTGFVGLLFIDLDQILIGNFFAISISGLIILPFSFAALAYATRYTYASNISLLMLLETIFGPVWVWLFLKETPNIQMITGGIIVIITLAIYFIALKAGERN